MELLVFQRGFTPGRATLRTLRSFSANVEAGLDDHLRAESAARQTGDTNEAQARTSADTALGQRITDEASARSAADTTEAQTRAAADAQEKADRQAADTAEATARSNADAGLQTQITAEVTARQNAVTAEITARAAADTALDGRLATVESKLPRTATLTYPGSDLTWTFPTAFAAGVVPVIEAVVEAAATSTALFNCQIVGPPTNTSVKLRINTIPAATVALGGLLSLTLFQQAPSGVKLHVTARIPQ